MGKEIERKFLVKKNSFPEENGKRIIQGFLSLDKERVVRIRIKEEKAFLTIKSGSHAIERTEFEYRIPTEDAEKLLETVCIKPLISKTRYHILYANINWEVDVFEGENKGLVIAEVELEDKHQKVKLPGWVGKEVTGDPRYYNINLVNHPYTAW